LKALTYPLRVLQNRVGAVPRPSFCTYLVCNRCNALCQMCDSWKLPRGYELTAEEVAAVFGKIGALDVVRLTGGEPFLREDLGEVAEAVIAASRPRVLHVTTNGSFPDRVERFARGVRAPSRLRVMVSLDGLAPEHDRNRGRSVTFERALETVRRLVRLRSTGLDVSVNHTIISPQSLRDHDGLCRTFQALNVDVHWVLAYEDSAMYGLSRRGTRADDLVVGRGYPLHSALDLEESLAFVERELDEVGNLRDPALRVGKRYYLRGLAERLAGEKSPRPRPKCVALRSHLRLLPDGGVPVCQFNTEIVGNLLHQSLKDVWHGEKAKPSRAWVDACSGCWAECEVVPNAVYSGDIWRGAVSARASTPGMRRRRARRRDGT
jgi:MoaA/NifB/PqqE/SkfB family radical SAM enzyme